ncbi:trimethyllysine dioxygenase, mitochondrial [Elysia marginata]|uniref:Trimethyllysine dioxygenase, mitochondrial n=1 Tax=Elysia marginata TaxID=1093978 RepID=A0AAV4IGE2_9GAST|nr:trimethyllysine dioxygenase, mitochondrial [Elysia marginata]
MKGVNVSLSTIRRSAQILLAQPNSKVVPQAVRLTHHLVKQQSPILYQQQQQQQQTRAACNSALCNGKCKKKNARRPLKAAAVSGGNFANHKHTGSLALTDDDAGPEVNRRDEDQVLEVRVTPDGQLARFPYMWLRDHCHSDRYFNHSTQQKIPDLELLQRDLTPEDVHADDKSLFIKWRDGHETEYSFEWLAEHSYPGKFCRRTKRVMWDKKKIHAGPLPAVPFEYHMNSEEGLRESLQNLVKYGFTMVTETPPTAEGTKQASERVSPIQESMYGGLWTVSPSMGNNDTAYTHASLGAHTDNTYLTSPAGIEVFHLLEHDGTGGESLLVDGFNAVDTVRREDPKAYQTLRDTLVPFEYMATAADGKPPYLMKAYSPIFTEHPGTGELLTFRFNAYDRGVMDTVGPSELAQFYKAYQHLSEVISRPESEFWHQMRPGTVVLVDNWRVMHGRGAFTGFRLLSGCYLSRDEWISQARMYDAL